MASSSRFRSESIFVWMLAGMLTLPPNVAYALETIAGVERWVPTGSLHRARMGHTATLLRDGRVLVVGGHTIDQDPLSVSAGDDVLVASAEIYDPASGRWTLIDGPARAGHTSTLLADGRVLVAGGQFWGKSDNTAEIFDPAAGTWTSVGAMSHPRGFHSAALLANGKVLVAGGRVDWMSDTVMQTAELFDPQTNTWTSTGNMQTPHSRVPAMLLPNGNVMVYGGDFGGYISAPTVSDLIEIYDPDTGTWATLGSSGGGRTGYTATSLPSGDILIGGGGTASALTERTWAVYDPMVDGWSAKTWRPIGRSDHTATLLANGTVLVAGGSTYVDTANRASASTERFDPARAEWSASPDLSVARTGHTATLLKDGRVLVVGGNSGDPERDPAIASAELYSDLPAGTLDSGYTGSWYDPAQSGHGLHIEVLPDNQFLAAWFTFDPTGTQQAWFMGTGTYSGNTATVASVVQPVGGRWIPNFETAAVVNRPWGTLTFTFTDCNHGRVDFISMVPGYGGGSMNLTRLTRPAGLSCP